jgi:hypothetical protein
MRSRYALFFNILERKYSQALLPNIADTVSGNKSLYNSAAEAISACPASETTAECFIFFIGDENELKYQ